MIIDEGLLIERSKPGLRAVRLPECDVPAQAEPPIPARFRREVPAELPEVTEGDLARHYTRLSQKNFCVDTHFYPLGSCTMKYNPKVNEDFIRDPVKPPAQYSTDVALSENVFSTTNTSPQKRWCESAHN